MSKHDKGMYQCMVRSGDETSQSSAELALGGIYCINLFVTIIF